MTNNIKSFNDEEERKMKYKSEYGSGFKFGYGIKFFILLILTGIYQPLIKNIAPHSLSAFMAFLVSSLGATLDMGAFYFFVLWIIDIIRRRGGIERKENKKVKLVVTIIFAILLIGIIFSILSTLG